MKKKVFFIVTSLGAGGSEKVFWTLSQGFDKELYDVTLVILDSRDNCFSMEVDGVRLIDLESMRASRSFIKLYRLIKNERPDAIFSTTNQINLLVSLVSRFVRIPVLIARASNIPEHMRLYSDTKDKLLSLLTKSSYKCFKTIVCQSEEMKHSLLKVFNIQPEKLMVIPNPVMYTSVIKAQHHLLSAKKLIVVARLAREKGVERLLDIVHTLPDNYFLTVVGDGSLSDQIQRKIMLLNLTNRVEVLSKSENVSEVISKHDLFVLTSYTEGFPNAVLDALSVGVPVISYRVGGISRLIKEGFNGYIVEQGDPDIFRRRVISACNTIWDAAAIKRAVYRDYALDKVSEQYQRLIN